MPRGSGERPTKGSPGGILGRVPPHAEEAEQALLGAILVDDKVLPLVQDIVTADDFYVEPHRAIYEAMVDLSNRGVRIDAVTLTELLKQRGQYDRVGGASYLDRLIDVVPVSAHAEEHANLIRGKAIVRRLILACHRVISDSYQDYGDLDSILDGAEQAIFEVSRRRHRSETLHIRRALDEVFAELDALMGASKEVTGVPTGFPRLDSLTAGFQPSDLIILAGRPTVGKTSCLLNMATAAAYGKIPVAFFSLEMSRQQVVRRILSSEAGVSSTKIRTGHRVTHDDFTRLVAAADRLRRLPLYLDDAPILTVAQLRGRVRRLKLEHGIGLVAIDYLQLLRPTRTFDNREREIAEISRSLKALAKELDLPVIAISQLSRDVEKRQDRRPILADLRESGAIEQDADIVIFLHAPNPEDKNQTHREIELIVAKHRSGPTGTMRLIFNSQYTRFTQAASRDMDLGTGIEFEPREDSDPF